jgi:biopolymer transport protein ExbD
MTWQARHEGSPQSVSLTLEELQDGLADGRWEPTDEVMGPGDADWAAIENHPALAELAADLEPPEIKHYSDESHLDMNAMIDVCLVLLVFFILTTTVAALQHRMEAPTAEEKGKVGVLKVTKEQVEQTMIHVSAKMEGGEPVVKLEGAAVELSALPRELRKLVGKTKKSQLLLEHDDDVPHDYVVQIMDAAKGARMDGVRLLLP